MMEKSIVIIAPGSLPLPAVRGGAVETGIQQIVLENEIYKKSRLIIFSPFDREAEIKSKELRYTKIIYIKLNVFERNTHLLVKIFNKLFCILKFDFRFLKFPCYIWKVKREIRKLNIRAILIKNCQDYVIALKSLNIPIFLQMHNDFLNSQTYRAKEIVSNCKGLIANSNYIATCMKTINEIQNKEIFINHNCVDSIFIDSYKIQQDELEAIRIKYNISKQNCVIVIVGRIVRDKGIKELILALKNIGDTVDFKLLVIGNKWFDSNIKDKYYAEVIELIDENLKKKIVFTGYIEHKSIPILYKCADIAVVPSIWNEPAGRVVLEAEACSIPLIVSKIGGIVEYTDENCARFVEVNDMFVSNLTQALSELIANPYEREMKGKNGCEFAKKFYPTKYYNEIIGYIFKETSH